MSLRWSEEQLSAYLRKDQPPVLLEATFQAAVMQLAKQYGWMAYHTFDSRKSPSGFPDLVLARKDPGHLCYAVELKTDTGQVTPAQQAWLTALTGCTGVVAETWRPSMLDNIVAQLRR